MESIITIPASGAVATLSVSAPAGLVLYNDHDTASVTISSHAQIIPGAGVVIRPKGTVRWTAPGEPIYGVTGSGIPVPILVTDDVGEIASPLDIAVATATRLSTEGIPSVMLSDVPFSGALVREPDNANQLMVPVDLSRYASVQVVITITDTTGPHFTYSWYSYVNGVYRRVSTRLITLSDTFTITLTLPVEAQYFGLSRTADVTVIGTNRDLLLANNYQHNFARVLRNDAWTAGTTYLLNGPGTTISGGRFQHSGGLVHFACYAANPGGAQIEGVMKVEFGNYNVDLFHTNAMGASAVGNGKFGTFRLPLPTGSFRFFFTPTTTHSAGTVQLDVIPE